MIYIYICTMDLYVLFERCLLSTIIVLIIVIFPQKTRDGGQDALLVGRVFVFFDFFDFFEFWPSSKRKLVGRVHFFLIFFVFFDFFEFWPSRKFKKIKKIKKKTGLLFF